MPSYTKQNQAVSIGRFFIDTSDQFNFDDALKLFLIQADSRFMVPDFENLVIADGEIGILDFQGFKFAHLWKVVAHFSSLRLYLRFVQEAAPYKLSQSHFVNCSFVLTKLMSLIRPFVNKTLMETMHFHSSGYESLHEFVPKELLPFEYGGHAGDIFTINRATIESVECQRGHLLDDSNWNLAE